MTRTIDRRPPTKLRRAIKWFLLLLLVALAIDSAWYEPLHPVLSTYDVVLPGLPKSLDGFRIVQLSDFHRSIPVSDSLIRNAVRMANRSHADVALLTGDFVSKNAKNARPCCSILKSLRTRFGSYAVLGNHDYWTDSKMVSEAVEASGIKLLTNRNVRLPNGLRLVGIDDEWSGAPDEIAAFRGVGKSECCIVMAHSPTSITRLKGRVGLLVVGHTHGGQVNLPFITSKLISITHHCRYVSGWYRQGRVSMYVNRGLGTVFPNLRFRCRPEVTLFVLHPASNSAPVLK